MQPGNKQSPLQNATLTIFVIFTLTASLIPTRVLAHKVKVFAWVEGDKVLVEGYYSGKKKAQNSRVEIFSGAGAKLMEGRTNEKGEFSFKPSEKTDLRIVLTDGTGHKSDFVISASDFGNAYSSVSNSPGELQRNKGAPFALTADPPQLEDVIDKALDRKLAPIIKLIRDTRREGPTLTEIIGGIGYIFGLFGLFLYFKSRKRNK